MENIFKKIYKQRNKLTEHYDKTSVFYPIHFLENYNSYVLNAKSINLESDWSLENPMTIYHQLELTKTYIDMLRKKIETDIFIRTFNHRNLDRENEQAFPFYYHPFSLLGYKEVGKCDIDSNSMTILTYPWKQARTVKNLITIKDWQQDKNHKAIYIQELNLVIIEKGNHSSMVGIYRNNLKMINVPVYSIADLFEKVYFDGQFYRDIKTNEIIVLSSEEQDHNYLIDVLYELIRNQRILENKLSKLG